MTKPFYSKAEAPLTPLSFQYNDGGREEAGYRGFTGDCAVRAAAIATGRPYKEIYREFKKEGHVSSMGSPFKKGTSWDKIHTFLRETGFTLFYPPHTRFLYREHVPDGVVVVSIDKHLTTVINGVIHDTFDPSNHGLRKVEILSYWKKRG